MAPEGNARGWRRVGVLRPLEVRDFRLLWSGLAISLIGDGIFFVALPWQVLELSNSPTALALVGAVWTVPMVVFLLLGGVIADRFDRRRVMLTADAIRLVANATLGVLSVTGHVELWHVFLLAALYGVGEALFFPAFSALVPEIVPTQLLVQANSLDSFVRPLGAQLLGPAVGGVSSTRSASAARFSSTPALSVLDGSAASHATAAARARRALGEQGRGGDP